LCRSAFRVEALALLFFGRQGALVGGMGALGLAPGRRLGSDLSSLRSCCFALHLRVPSEKRITACHRPPSTSTHVPAVDT
jgi:hypothetical protein